MYSDRRLRLHIILYIYSYRFHGCRMHITNSVRNQKYLYHIVLAKLTIFVKNIMVLRYITVLNLTHVGIINTEYAG